MRSPAPAGVRRNRARSVIARAISRIWASGAQDSPVQSLEQQIEFAHREHIPFPVISDPSLRLGKALALPTFEFGGATLYKRITLVLEAGHVSHVFYPVFPPDRNADEVVAWLRAREERS